jgi:hypothetical protein
MRPGAGGSALHVSDRDGAQVRASAGAPGWQVLRPALVNAMVAESVTTGRRSLYASHQITARRLMKPPRTACSLQRLVPTLEVAKPRMGSGMGQPLFLALLCPAHNNSELPQRSSRHCGRMAHIVKADTKPKCVALQ